MIEKLFTLSFEGSWRRISKPFLSRGVEILDGGFARPKVNIDVSRARPLDRISFFLLFFSPLLLNMRILSTRSFRSGFRVFRLSGVTSSSRGSLIKSR